MSYDILGDYGDTLALVDSAGVSGQDQSFVTPAWGGTVDLNASDVTTQVTANSPGKTNQFWEAIGTNLLGYAIAKDAVRSGVTRAGGMAQSSGTVPQNTQRKVQGGIQPVHVLLGVVVLAGVWLVSTRA